MEEKNTGSMGEDMTKINIDQPQAQFLRSQIESEQNLPLAVLAAAVAACAGAALWATITALTNYQIGFMAIGVGFLVGYAVRYFGKGIEILFGVTGGVFSLLGCLAGNFLTIVYWVAAENDASFWTLLSSVDLPLVIDVMTETFEFIDLVFYAIAVYEGYKISFRPMPVPDVIQKLS